MIWLICDFMPFYAHVHTCSPSQYDKYGWAYPSWTMRLATGLADTYRYLLF